RRLNSALKIFCGNRVLCAFVLPVDRQNPPAFAVIEELKAVYAAHEWFGIAQTVTRFVCAPNMSDPSKLLRYPRDFRFVETFLQKWFHSRDVLFDIQQLRFKFDVVSSRDTRRRHYAGIRIKERPLAIPVVLLSSRPGDYIVSGDDDCVDRLHVARISWLRH